MQTKALVSNISYSRTFPGFTLADVQMELFPVEPLSTNMWEFLAERIAKITVKKEVTVQRKERKIKGSTVLDKWGTRETYTYYRE